jgi:SAM-dependent methyltransferase
MELLSMIAGTHRRVAIQVRQCPLCGSLGDVRYRLENYEIHRCQRCGADYNAWFKGGGGTGELFDRDYFEVRHKEAFAAAQFDDHTKDPSAAVFLRRLDQIERALGVGSVLDVGPGLGTFLRLAVDRGWRAEGVEVSAFAADFIRKQHKVPVFTGDLVSFAASVRRTFDLITFWDSLEHVTHPRDVLEAARQLLRPGGMIVVTTDNFDCLVADLSSALYRLSRGRWRYPMERVFIDRNRTYFTERSLRSLVRHVGLDVVFFEKMEYPLSKIKTTPFERIVLRSLYGLAHVTRRQAQITLFARS